MMGSEWRFKFNAGRSFRMFVVGLEKFVKVSKSFHLRFSSDLKNSRKFPKVFITFLWKKNLKFHFDLHSTRSRAVRFNQAYLTTHRQHLIRPRRCVKLHFMPCVYIWPRTVLRPRPTAMVWQTAPVCTGL